ncbi:DUF6229 family protein [Myxococcaceae bacterium GXIMD 01537]
MSKATEARVDEIVSGWLSGSETTAGMNNPAGPLYVGGASAVNALTDEFVMLVTRCSSCTASVRVYCC